MLLVRDLAEGCSRFCELERSLAGISPRTLSLRLRALEEEGIVERHTYAEVPPRVEYALTEKGRALLPIIDDMRAYGEDWLGDASAPSAADGSRAVVGRRRRRRGSQRLHARRGASGLRGQEGGETRSQRTMHSLQLQAALTEFVEDGRGQLRAELGAGAEVRSSSSRRGRAAHGAPLLYCYRALTGQFIADASRDAERLPSYGAAATRSSASTALTAISASVGAEPGRPSPARAGARRCVRCCEDVFEEQSDFELRPERAARGARASRARGAAAPGEVTLVATLHGLDDQLGRACARRAA